MTDFVTLSEARENAGYTQVELARELGMPRATLWNWESGRCLPTRRDAVAAVARVLGVRSGSLVVPIYQ